MTKTKLTTEEILDIDNTIWDELGARNGADIDKKYELYKAAVSQRIDGTITQEQLDEIEDENHHSMVQALSDLRRIKN